MCCCDSNVPILIHTPCIVSFVAHDFRTRLNSGELRKVGKEFLLNAHNESGHKALSLKEFRHVLEDEGILLEQKKTQKKVDQIIFNLPNIANEDVPIAKDEKGKAQGQDPGRNHTRAA